MTIPYEWYEIQNQESKDYVCGYCGKPLASEKGWIATTRPTGAIIGRICVCHLCGQPTFFDRNGHQTPGVMFGNSVRDIPDKSVSDLYNEARMATGVNSYTAAVLACRKLLMQIAVSKGAERNQDFVSYVQYLADKHYIPPDAEGWVDQIRKRGNEANHEIRIMTKEEAEELISFAEMLLKVVFEFPAKVKRA